jgi:hypothetical protein
MVIPGFTKTGKTQKSESPFPLQRRAQNENRPQQQNRIKK